ncbi:MAG: hypothetical protein HYU64_11305 [Armatimonadetes bacterium]|nr:hypothetical protein [Armatimonadota bacterium]
MRSDSARIFIGLCEIAGYNAALKKGFDELGAHSIFFELINHDYEYQEEANNAPTGSLRFYKALSSSKIIRNIFWTPCRKLFRILLFVWALFQYDVFIFGFRSSFFYFYDLPILKFFRKRIIYIFFGSDSRPPYISGRYFDSPIQECVRVSDTQKKQIRKIEKYADIIISHPPSSHFHERQFIPFMRMGFPRSINDAKTADSGHGKNKLRILHAPSDPERKGTEIIRERIRNLQIRGHSIELIEIIGKPNAQVLDELSRCDFVIDELYSDTAMAGFAVEAAHFGKPAIVSGYANAYDWGNLPAESIPPVHYCHPDGIEEAIEKLIIDEAYRIELGNRAKEFVKKQWSAKKVAERYLILLKGGYPDNWLYDPKEIRYLHGWGLSEEKAKALVHRTIRQGSVRALQLSDKTDLERRFVEFVRSERS